MQELLEHIIEIKERLSVIETQGDELRKDLKDHAKASAATASRVDALENDVVAAKASIGTVKLLIAWCFGIPGVLVGIVQLFNILTR